MPMVLKLNFHDLLITHHFLYSYFLTVFRLSSSYVCCFKLLNSSYSFFPYIYCLFLKKCFSCRQQDCSIILVPLLVCLMPNGFSFVSLYVCFLYQIFGFKRCCYFVVCHWHSSNYSNQVFRCRLCLALSPSLPRKMFAQFIIFVYPSNKTQLCRCRLGCKGLLLQNYFAKKILEISFIIPMMYLRRLFLLRHN